MQQQEEPDVGEQQQYPQATPSAATPQTEPRPHECGVCLFVYDELERRPRTLPCGHTYCSMCVSVLLLDGQLTCPSCRTNHQAAETNHFPISYALEAMVKVMRAQQVEAASHNTGEVPQVSPKTSQATEVKIKRRVTAGLSRKLRSMIQEQSVSIESLETTLQKELEQLNGYRAKLAGSRTEHANLLKELDKLVQQHQSNMDLLQEEDVRVEGFMEEGEEVQRELRAALGRLGQVSAAQEAITTIDAADHTIVEVEEWLQHSREEIPNGTVLSTSFTMLEATKASLEVITEETKATRDQATSGHPDCTIMEAVEDAEQGPVEFKDLHTNKLRKKLNAGKVFATQKYEDGTYFSSKVISEDNKVYLHTLKKESPPRGALNLQVSKVVENLDYPNTSVFLDLSWPGTSQRVYIRLKADTPLTRQFVTLCLGHTGLTYCNTNFVRNEACNHSRLLWGGDISGQKAAANYTLPPIQVNECGNTFQVSNGMVVAGNVSDVAQRTQFGITIPGGRHYTNPSYYCLGTVESDGMNTLRTVLNNYYSTDVRVVNCGVVC